MLGDWFNCGVAAGLVLYKIELAGYLFEFGLLLRRWLQLRSLLIVQVYSNEQRDAGMATEG